MRRSNAVRPHRGESHDDVGNRNFCSEERTEYIATVSRLRVPPRVQAESRLVDRASDQVRYSSLSHLHGLLVRTGGRGVHVQTGRSSWQGVGEQLLLHLEAYGLADLHEQIVLAVLRFVLPDPELFLFVAVV